MVNQDQIKIIECPRDAMQGLSEFIPTDLKAEYINKLLKVGFDTIDFGSFVSPSAVPQMKDTAEVLSKLDLSSTNTELLAIIANLKGAQTAAQFDEIKYLGFPFSISDTFQRKNVNATIIQSLGRVEDITVIHEICKKHNKKMVIYISMGFGNPYGDPWSIELIHNWIYILKNIDIDIIALADTVGIGNPNDIEKIFASLIPEFPSIEFGAHFHTTPDKWHEKIESAYKGGCRRFDGAIKGYGGCPLSGYHLVGNMPTENITSFFDTQNIDLKLNNEVFFDAINFAGTVFPKE
jgi:hydroxymethylglutaryl-CoA lyase